MAMRIVASRPDPAILGLPWHLPLEEWPDDVVVPLPRGLSRHVVRIVRLGERVYAVKETQDDIAFREYRMLRDLQRIGMPAVVPQGVVTGRQDSTVASCTCDMRCASPRWMTSGFVVVQAARATTIVAISSFFISVLHSMHGQRTSVRRR